MPGYVDAFKPLMRRPARLSSLVPWRKVLDHALGILSTRDDGFLCCVKLESPDLGSLSLDEQDSVTERLNEAWKLLPPGSAVWHHLHRRPADLIPGRLWPSPVAQLLDDEHTAALNAPGACWQTDTYLSFYHRRPRSHQKNNWSRYFLRAGRPSGASYTLEDFTSDTSQVLGLLTSVCPTVERLTGRDLTAYLHRCVSVHDHPLAVDDLDLGLHTATADSGFWPGTVPIIGDFLTKQYVRSVTLSRQFPAGTATALFRDLHRLPFAFDVVTRWLPKARQEAKQVTDKQQVNWLSMRHGWRSYAYEMRTGQKPDIKNTFISKQGDDADTARDHILSGDYQLGRLTMVFMVRGDTSTLEPSPEEMAEGNTRLSQLATVVRTAGCSVIDDPINQTETFVGTWPGAAYANIDDLEMTSLNFATLALSHAPWKGIAYNVHLKSPPLVYAKTEGCMRIGVDTFVGDLGDSVLVGPKGSGKSTTLAKMDACWLVDASRHLAHFDVGGSCECAIRCLGGQYHDLAREVSLQVMADLDQPHAVAWIFNWLKRRVAAAGVPKHPDIDTFLWGGLDGPDSLRDKRDRPRTLTEYLYWRQLHANKISGLASAHGSDRMRELALLTPNILGALRPFAQGGAYGHLTDAPVDRLQIGRVHGFELEALLKLTDAYSPVLEILFYRLKARRDGSPTRYVFDEAWHYLNTDTWVDILKNDMPAWRREQTSGLFATQSISQLEGSPLTALLMESAQTRFFLPNPKALDTAVGLTGKSIADAYRGMGLGDEEIRRNIVMAQPKGELYWTIPDDRHGRPQRRLIDLRLGQMNQGVCGANTPMDHAAMREIVATYPAEEFAIHWFAHRGFGRESAALASQFQSSLHVVHA